MWLLGVLRRARGVLAVGRKIIGGVLDGFVGAA
jgi:hypothetical protein